MTGVARAKLAGQVADRVRVQRAVPRNREAVGQLRAARVELELHDGHRRDRRQVVRIEHAEQRVGQLGELVVELVLDAAGEQGERLDQPLDVRVGAAVGLEQQPAGGGRDTAGRTPGPAGG